jgi:hypothetical protein
LLGGRDESDKLLERYWWDDDLFVGEVDEARATRGYV